MAKMSLGRGLGAILGEIEESYHNEMQRGVKEPQEILVSAISPNPFQPRTVFDDTALEELSESIKRHGLLQPILVIPAENDTYTLIAGERRLRAHIKAGLETIKAVVTDIDLTKLRELAIIENIQREDLNPLELARSLNELIHEYHITHDKLAEMVKKSRTFITNSLRLLSLSSLTQSYLEQSKITAGHAKVLVGLSEDDEEEIVKSIVGQKLSVRQTEELIANLKKENNRSVSIMKKLASLQQVDPKPIVNELKTLGYNVKNVQNKITVTFKNDEEIENFLKMLKKTSHFE